jgi:LysM repeat protein
MNGHSASDLPKATIEIYRRDSREDAIEVLFNPPEYSVSRGVKYASTSILGMSTPLTQFVSGEADTVALDLFLDTTISADTRDGTDVREFVQRLEKLVLIDPELHAPLHCKFIWGGPPFKATVAKLDTTYTKFKPNGVPVRAKVKMTLTEYKTFEEVRAKSQKYSADLARAYVVKDGDNLWLIAHEKYGDVKCWKHIARANGITNPLDLEPGTELVLPPKG